jgi:hypothetical protein
LPADFELAGGPLFDDFSDEKSNLSYARGVIVSACLRLLDFPPKIFENIVFFATFSP